MSGKFGVNATKELVTTVKLATMAILQKVAKDGFQADDLLAPLGSAEFKASLEPIARDIALVIPELSELDFMDAMEIGKALYAAWNDIKTELSAASLKMQSVKK